MNDMEQFEKAVEDAIEEMESPDYVFPKRYTKTDYIITLIVEVVCLAATLLGIYLK